MKTHKGREEPQANPEPETPKHKPQRLLVEGHLADHHRVGTRMVRDGLGKVPGDRTWAALESKRLCFLKIKSNLKSIVDRP